MKSNQIMIRDNSSFMQRTKDGYFSATALMNSWNEANKDDRKFVTKFKDNKSTKSFIEQLEKEGISKPLIASNKGTWMHPKLFIDFAMWVSIEFKSTVIDYVLDGLIQSRHDAGDYYNEMCATILETYIDYYGRKPNPSIYISEARRIRSILGLDGKDRNEMSKDELSNITHLQKMNVILLKKKMGLDARVRLLKIHAESLSI